MGEQSPLPGCRRDAHDFLQSEALRVFERPCVAKTTAPLLPSNKKPRCREAFSVSKVKDDVLSYYSLYFNEPLALISSNHKLWC
ncbi:hypothetical protein STH12_03593 [Shewanella khirikhana]|uniref:Uncharacterized protein n=1 Tax=Shewanella khirikhana TaxID=1965282 RepID=A0ABM7DSG8_9GAMM|nr:hypothetical protein STH12_03593 [Shewanella khirikhana]